LKVEVSELLETSNATNLTLQGNYILIAFADFSLLLIHFVLPSALFGQVFSVSTFYNSHLTATII